MGFQLKSPTPGVFQSQFPTPMGVGPPSPMGGRGWGKTLNPLITQILLGEKFFVNIKFVDLIEFYKLDFHKKIVTQKQLSDQGVCHTDIEKFYGRTHFKPVIQEMYPK